jgi:hypothetical protein
MSSKSLSEDVTTPIYAHLSKTMLPALMKNLIQIQCWHNEVEFTEDQAQTLKKFQKHIKAIYDAL